MGKVIDECTRPVHRGNGDSMPEKGLWATGEIRCRAPVRSALGLQRPQACRARAAPRALEARARSGPAGRSRCAQRRAPAPIRFRGTAPGSARAKGLCRRPSSGVPARTGTPQGRRPTDQRPPPAAERPQVSGQHRRSLPQARHGGQRERLRLAGSTRRRMLYAPPSSRACRHTPSRRACGSAPGRGVGAIMVRALWLGRQAAAMALVLTA